MIEAKELRIGNWFVNHLNQLEQVGQIRWLAIYMVNKSALIDIKPIPLTEEWLIKFGFKLSKDGKYYNGRDSPIFWVYGNQYGMSGLPLSTSFSHVHSLQNLYFALTGEELTIKE